MPDQANKKTDEALGKANLLGDLILPVKVNPDLPIKLLFGRSWDLKGEELPDQANKTRKLMKHWERANLLGDLILPVKVNPDLPIKLLFGRSGA